MLVERIDYFPHIMEAINEYGRRLIRIPHCASYGIEPAEGDVAMKLEWGSFLDSDLL